MTKTHFEKLVPEAFEEAAAEAYGAIAGWCMGKGEDPPYLTAVVKEAYEKAFSGVFDAGYRAGHASALDREEWRVTVFWARNPGRRHVWSEHDKEEDARRDYAVALADEDGWDEPQLEHRRVGMTEWEQVPS